MSPVANSALGAKNSFPSIIVDPNLKGELSSLKGSYIHWEDAGGVSTMKKMLGSIPIIGRLFGGDPGEPGTIRIGGVTTYFELGTLIHEAVHRKQNLENPLSKSDPDYNKKYLDWQIEAEKEAVDTLDRSKKRDPNSEMLPGLDEAIERHRGILEDFKRQKLELDKTSDEKKIR